MHCSILRIWRRLDVEVVVWCFDAATPIFPKMNNEGKVGGKLERNSGSCLKTVAKDFLAALKDLLTPLNVYETTCQWLRKAWEIVGILNSSKTGQAGVNFKLITYKILPYPCLRRDIPANGILFWFCKEDRYISLCSSNVLLNIFCTSRSHRRTIDKNRNVKWRISR